VRGRWWAGILVAALLAATGPLAAQLRPLGPLDGRSFDPGVTLTAQAGIGLYRGQELALAGTEGRLVEVGEYRLTWRTGRVVFEGRGTAFRVFDDGRPLREPTANVTVPYGTRRSDSGDHLVLTSVRITPEEWATRGIVRFGTRLPTTNDRTGLERDMIDFVATAAALRDVGGLRLSAEAGVGIHGTRDPDFEQADVVLYMLEAEYRARPLGIGISVIGQTFPAPWAMRGNEDLGEARLSLRTGGRTGLEFVLIRGYVQASPAGGLSMAVRGAW
jgi:hypothetical protein